MNTPVVCFTLTLLLPTIAIAQPEPALVYSGHIQDAQGAPISGSHNFEFRVLDSSNNQLCSDNVVIEVPGSGFFSIPLSIDCRNAIRPLVGRSFELLVDNNSLGVQPVQSNLVNESNGYTIDVTQQADCTKAKVTSTRSEAGDTEALTFLRIDVPKPTGYSVSTVKYLFSGDLLRAPVKNNQDSVTEAGGPNLRDGITYAPGELVMDENLPSTGDFYLLCSTTRSSEYGSSNSSRTYQKVLVGITRNSQPAN